jgi:hypothetical protein
MASMPMAVSIGVEGRLLQQPVESGEVGAVAAMTSPPWRIERPS